MKIPVLAAVNKKTVKNFNFNKLCHKNKIGGIENEKTGKKSTDEKKIDRTLLLREYWNL